MPFPAAFTRVVKAKWEAPARPTSNHSIILMFYSLVPEVVELFKLPLVDDPVGSLCSIVVLPVDADRLP